MTETITAEQPADEVTAAEQEAREADDLLVALEERVRDGDDKITPQQLTEQRELGRFARLRAEAARRKAERAQAKAAEERRQQQHRAALDLLAEKADPARLAAAYTAARGAIEALLDVSDAFDDSVTEAAEMLRKAGAPEARGEHGTPTAPAWVRDGGRALVAFGPDDMRAANGASVRLSVLLADVARDRTPVGPGWPGIRTSPNSPQFLAAPIQQQANGRSALRPRLDQLDAAGK